MIMEIVKYLAMALASGLLLVLISKFGLQHIIRKNNFYYESKELSEEREMLKKAGIEQPSEAEGIK